MKGQWPYGCLEFMDQVSVTEFSKYKCYRYQTTTRSCNTTNDRIALLDLVVATLSFPSRLYYRYNDTYTAGIPEIKLQ